ncbi:RsfA family transcriptional regulator [Halobacillus rhizosphaerae]|uniref:RsfA family transcriptional regulator n=1 Tax=Halobacillus rhizosphaerae TaxID=3064889 RepID=UPI00398B81C2
MDAPRQDAWKEEEDTLLAETVLKYICEGKTQLEAFQEVAERLRRTPAACGFRWNATVRKDYQNEIQEAKLNRKEKRAVFATASALDDPPMSLDAAISFLKEMKMKQYESQGKQKLEYELRQLSEDNKRLKGQLKQFEAAWMEMDKLVTWVKERHKSPL